MFVLLAMFWGTSFVAIEVGIPYFPPMLFAAIRYTIAGLLILGYAVVATDRWLPDGREEWLGVFLGAAFIIAGYHGLLYLGVEHVSGALAAVIVSLSPVLTAGLASSLNIDEGLGAVGVIGLLSGFLGVIVVADPDPNNVLSASLIGILLVFLGSLAFALGSVLTRPIRTDLPAVSMQAWSMLLGSGMLFGFGAIRGESVAAIRWTAPAVASLVYLSVISGAVAYAFYFDLLDRLGPTEINLIGYLEPVVSTTLSWLFLGSIVSVTTITGFAAIFAGFVMIKRELFARLLSNTAGAMRPRA